MTVVEDKRVDNDMVNSEPQVIAEAIAMCQDRQVFVGGTERTDMVSTSLDNTKFILPAYSLRVGTLYTIKLSVLSTVSGKGSIASVNVFVSSGKLVAVIRGGSSQSGPATSGA